LPAFAAALGGMAALDAAIGIGLKAKSTERLQTLGHTQHGHV
jgi:hypothetical protein